MKVSDPIIKKLLLFPLFLLLASCMQTESLSENNKPAESPINQQEAFTSTEVEQDYGKAFENAAELQLFLYEDSSTVSFEGEGNEYASYTIKTDWLSDHYVRYEQDNGGVVLAKYYRIDSDGIYLVDQVADEAMVKTVTELENLPVLSTELMAPITIGTTFDGWTITATEASYTTPYDAFNKVIVLEKQTDTILERQYYVAGVGPVAYEFEMTDENGEVSMITSKLALITY